MTLQVREATLDDLAGVAAVAVATDQEGEGAGADPRYAAHLLSRGRLVVATDRRDVVGYAASVRIDDADLLSDLFVVPARHGEGIGRDLLQQVWTDAPERMTFSSAHPSALPLYVRFGLLPRWPVLYLRGDPGALPAGPFEVVDVDRATAEAVEAELGGGNRSAEYGYWAVRPGARLLVVEDGLDRVAVGATGGEGETRGLSHLRAASPEVTAGVLLSVLATMDGDVLIAAPGPIGGVEELVAAGWRLVDTDQFAASAAELVDPTVLFPHPGLL